MDASAQATNLAAASSTIREEFPGLVATLSRDWGISEDEVIRNLELQDRVNISLDDALAATDPDGSRFTSLAFGNDAGRSVRIQATDDTFAHDLKEELNRRGADVGAINFEVVAVSAKDMDAQAALLAQQLGIARPDVGVMSRSVPDSKAESELLEIALDVDYLRQTLVVEASVRESEFARSVVRGLQDRVELVPILMKVVPGVNVSGDGCPSHHRCDPVMRGGLELRRNENASGTKIDGCTSGFNVRRSLPLPLQPNDGYITSGHCANTNLEATHFHRPDSWWPNHFTFGIRQSWENNSSGDHAFFSVSSFWYDGGRRDVIMRNLSVDAPLYLYGTASATTGLGTVICRSGHNVGERCGQIISLNATRGGTSGLLRLEHVKACGGDSGGPYYSPGGLAYGIHKTSTQGNAIPCGEQSELEDSYGLKIRLPSLVSAYWL
jgi:hypothetical protein